MSAGYTPTQKRLLAVLADGQPHTPGELLDCLSDPEMSSIATLRVHLSLLRNKLRPLGEDILCAIHNRTVHYRHVRLLSREGNPLQRGRS